MNKKRSEFVSFNSEKIEIIELDDNEMIKILETPKIKKFFNSLKKTTNKFNRKILFSDREYHFLVEVILNFLFYYKNFFPILHGNNFLVKGDGYEEVYLLDNNNDDKYIGLRVSVLEVKSYKPINELKTSFSDDELDEDWLIKDSNPIDKWIEALKSFDNGSRERINQESQVIEKMFWVNNIGDLDKDNMDIISDVLKQNIRDFFGKKLFDLNYIYGDFEKWETDKITNIVNIGTISTDSCSNNLNRKCGEINKYEKIFASNVVLKRNTYYHLFKKMKEIYEE